MLNIEKIQEEWNKDSIIKEETLNETILNCGRLHSKYLELFTKSKFQKKNEELALDILLKEKWLWYNGKMDKGAMDKKNWDYDPFNGLRKPLKNEMNYYYNADPDIQRQQKRILYINSTKEFLSEVMDNIKWRSQNIKNFIEWRKFTSGV